MSEVADSCADAGRPDPAAVDTPAEFVEDLRRLKRWSGLGYRQLEKRAAAIGESLPRSTLTAALTRDTLPREDLVAALVRTCGCDDDGVRRWVDSRRRIAAAARPDGFGPVPPPAAGATGVAARHGSGVALLGTVPWSIGQTNRPIRILFAALVGVVVVIVLLAAIGSIRDLAGDPAPTPGVVRTWYGANEAWTNTAHTRVGVEDREADGHGVYAEYIIRGGPLRTLADANGSDPGHSAEAA
ncbi:MAG: helix-turn-helix domain-containing protein, partial [Pseudonocardiaceae bacterium]